jgi:hypothetical protein
VTKDYGVTLASSEWSFSDIELELWVGTAQGA